MNASRLSLSFPLALLSVAALLPSAAHAHRTWLLPSAAVVSGKEPQVSVDAAVSEDLFEYDTNSLALDGLSIVAPDGSKLNAENLGTTRRRSSFDVKLTQPGTYRIVNFTETAMASYKVGGETKRWRGSLDALAKDVPANAEELQVTRMQNRVETYVTNDNKADNKADAKADPKASKAFTPQGSGLELIPLTTPTRLWHGAISKAMRKWRPPHQSLRRAHGTHAARCPWLNTRCWNGTYVRHRSTTDDCVKHWCVAWTARR
jgi:uncharacterized GH25 family protein